MTSTGSFLYLGFFELLEYVESYFLPYAENFQPVFIQILSFPASSLSSSETPVTHTTSP